MNRQLSPVGQGTKLTLHPLLTHNGSIYRCILYAVILNRWSLSQMVTICPFFAEDYLGRCST